MQRSTLTAIAAAVFVAGAVGVQSAEASSTSVTAVPVLIANQHGVSGATATANDANLVGRIINTVSVNVPAGHDWTNSELRIELTSGSVYNTPAATGGTDGSPNPAFWRAAAPFSPGAYDSFVNNKANPAGDVQATFIAGSVNPDQTSGQPPALGLQPEASPTQLVAVSWGNTVFGEEGTFQIGQFTLSPDANGRWFIRTFTSDSPPPGSYHFPVPPGQWAPVTNGVLTPEPTGLAGLLVVGSGLLLRRRRQA